MIRVLTTQPQAVPAPSDRGPRRGSNDDEDDEENLKRIAITVNPLGLIISRYSLTVEFLPATHHALSLSPFYTNVPVELNGQEISSFSGVGGEFGYRFYTGSKGPNGFYVGPSFLFSSYSQSGTNLQAGVTPGAEETFTAFGGAIDIGGQA